MEERALTDGCLYRRTVKLLLLLLVVVLLMMMLILSLGRACKTNSRDICQAFRTEFNTHLSSARVYCTCEQGITQFLHVPATYICVHKWSNIPAFTPANT